MSEAYTSSTLLTIVRSGLRDIGYQDSLLKQEYSFVDVFTDDYRDAIPNIGSPSSPVQDELIGNLLSFAFRFQWTARCFRILLMRFLHTR